MARAKEEKIDYEQFVVDHSKNSLSAGMVEEIGYGSDGLVMTDPNIPSCLAKQIKQLDTNTTRYFVKFSNVGPTAGNMVDPNEEMDMARRGDWTSHGRFSFRPVSQTAYDLYVRFLKTNNKAYLYQASREITL